MTKYVKSKSTMKSTLGRFAIENGSGTTSGDPDDSSVQITLESPLKQDQRPNIHIIPIGPLADVNVYVDNLVYSNNNWVLTVGSSIPSITFHYRVIGYIQQNEDKIPLNKTELNSHGDGVGGSY